MAEYTQEDLDFLSAQNSEPEPLTEDGLKSIQEKVTYYFEHALEAEKLELALAEEKKILNRMKGTDFPETLRKFGLDEIKLSSGEKITIKDGLSVTLTDEQKFYDFLRQRDEYDIVKTIIELPRADQDKLVEIYNYLDTTEINYEATVGIHAKTKESYFNRLLGGNLSKEDKIAALEEGKILSLDAVSDFAKTYTYFTTKITEPKGKKYGRDKKDQAADF